MDDSARLAELGTSFGGAAREYARHRPDYPDAAIDWCLESLPPEPVIVDLAAGTGKLTGGLGRFGGRVFAVEPDSSMLGQLPAALAHRVCAAAEGIPLRSGSVDAVIVGQAFHWFDGERAMAEIARVLRPGGRLAALWNYFDDSMDWVRRFDEIVSSARWWARQDRGSNVPEHPEFGEAERARFAHAHRRTAESLARTAGTHSHILTMSEVDRTRALGEVRELLGSHPATAHGEFDLPIITSAVRLTRR